MKTLHTIEYILYKKHLFLKLCFERLLTNDFASNYLLERDYKSFEIVRLYYNGSKTHYKLSKIENCKH